MKTWKAEHDEAKRALSAEREALAKIRSYVEEHGLLNEEAQRPEAKPFDHRLAQIATCIGCWDGDQCIIADCPKRGCLSRAEREAVEDDDPPRALCPEAGTCRPIVDALEPCPNGVICPRRGASDHVEPEIPAAPEPAETTRLGDEEEACATPMDEHE